MISRTSRSLSVLLLLGLILGGPAAAQERPQFRTTVALVQIQVSVADAEGKFLPGLGADDFVVEVNGQARPARVAYEVDLRRDPGTGAAMVGGAASAGRATPRPVAARRHWLMMFDFSFTSRRGLIEARRSALAFIASQVHPDDLLGVATVNRYGVTLLSPFTANHQQATEAVQTLGLFSASDMITGGFDAEESIGQALTELAAGTAGTDGGVGAALESTEYREYVASVANYTEQMQEFGKMLQAIEGRKHVVLFSRGFNDRALTGQTLGQLAAGAEARATSPEAFANDAEQMYGAAEVRDGLSEMVAVFRGADAVIHAVDPSGLRDSGAHDPGNMQSAVAGTVSSAGDIMPTASRTGHQSLSAMAEGTGGSANWMSNDLSAALTRIEEATASFYMIAYLRDAADPPTVDVKVRVKRPGSRVVSAPTRLTPPPAFEQMNAAQRQLQVAEYLNDDVERRQIAFDTQAVVFPGQASSSRLATILEVSGLELDRLAQLRGDGKVQFEIGGFALADSGAMLDSFRQRVTIDVAQMRARGDLAAQNFRFTEYVDTPPGQHRLRLLLRESVLGQLSSKTQRFYCPGPTAGLTLARPLVLSGLEVPVQHGDGGFDPLSLAGMRQLPVASPTLVPGEPFRLLVVAYGVPRDPASGEFLAGLALEAEDLEGDPYRLREFTILGSAIDEASGAAQLMVEARLPAHIRAGHGRLWARLVDQRSGQRVEEQTPIFVRLQ